MKKKLCLYLLAGIIPTLIFLGCATINDLLPFGKSHLNIYDAYTQYSGIILDYKNALLNGNLFYSFNGGGGYNLFGTICYYAISPLNLLCIFVTPQNYPYFIAIMTLMRIFLLGISMCFYLDKRGTKNTYTLLFSTIFALMGFTATYYYNFFWVDAIIMLPLVIHGLDKLINKGQTRFYTISLTITILINFYIGYMICLFCLIYFIYNYILIDNKKELLKKFLLNSILSGLMASVVLIPSYFALKVGKASLYKTLKYGGLNKNFIYFCYFLLSGSYLSGDQAYGPMQIYTSILVLILTIYYFFNKSITKKEKYVTLSILIFFLLSFLINVLNYAWQMFQKPVWWQSRYSFCFSFFLITIAIKTLENIDKTKIKMSTKIFTLLTLIVLSFIGLYYRIITTDSISIYTYIFYGFSLLLLIEFMFFINKKAFLLLIIILTFFDVSINTFNNLKQNNRAIYITYYQSLKSDIPKLIDKLNKENNNFYRFELVKPYLSNDGMYFNYNGINYFNSVRNNNATILYKNLGIKVIDDCDVKMKKFDPVFLSLFNVKYLYDTIDYFKVNNNYSENPYPLALGFMADKDILKVEVTKDKSDKENLNNIINGLLGYNVDLYEYVDKNEFEEDNVILKDNNYYIENGDIGYLKYSFTSKGNYLLMPSDISLEFNINGNNVSYNNIYIEIQKGDKVEVIYKLYGRTNIKDIYLYKLDMEKYKIAMENLNKNTLNVKTNTIKHLLEGNITVDKKGYLFTTINYEKGMKVYVDKKEVKPDIILNALIGLEIDKGNHTITIDYVPKGLKLGIVISSLSILSFIYLQIIKRKL